MTFILVAGLARPDFFSGVPIEPSMIFSLKEQAEISSPGTTLAKMCMASTMYSTDSPNRSSLKVPRETNTGKDIVVALVVETKKKKEVRFKS